MKKKVISIVVILLLFLLIPIPLHVKDGGTVHYEAILYTISNYHTMNGKGGYDTGFVIKVFGITIYRCMDPNNEILH